MSNVVILGCGPAGLAAAAAVASSGHKPIIVSREIRPSTQYGCQYLHAPIPGYEDVPSVRVAYTLVGTPEQYRHKVYGDNWIGRVSPEDFVGEHDAWDIRETYTRMWRDLIHNSTIPLIQHNLMPGRMRELRSRIRYLHAELIISTIPAPLLCEGKHGFTGHAIWANGTTLKGNIGQNEIVCDGTPAHPWYRVSNVFGHTTTEWPSKPDAPSAKVLKPLATECDCEPGILRIGRYGRWEKGYLVHQVYPEVLEAVR
jgi:hypothetical protein